MSPHPVLAAVDAGHIAHWTDLGDGEQKALRCLLDRHIWPCPTVEFARTAVRKNDLARRGQPT